MTCDRCGKILEPGELFCPACGKAVAAPAAPMAPAANETPVMFDEPAGVVRTEIRSSSVGAQYKAPLQTASTTAQYKAPAVSAEPVKEKEYFGKGALALCLVVIGILAASTGIFACLYFSLIGMI